MMFVFIGGIIMQVPVVGLEMPADGAEGSSLILTAVTKSEILKKVTIEQLRLSASYLVSLAIDYSEVRIDDNATMGISWSQEPITGSTDGCDIELKITVPDLTSASALSDSVRQTLGIPEAIELRPFTSDQVIDLIGDVLEFDVSSLQKVRPGVDESAVQLTSFGPRTKSGVHAIVESDLYVSIGCMNVSPMSVSNFGNFLYALKHGGQAVALATLYRIYSESP